MPRNSTACSLSLGTQCACTHGATRMLGALEGVISCYVARLLLRARRAWRRVDGCASRTMQSACNIARPTYSDHSMTCIIRRAVTLWRTLYACCRRSASSIRWLCASRRRLVAHDVNGLLRTLGGMHYLPRCLPTMTSSARGAPSLCSSHSMATSHSPLHIVQNSRRGRLHVAAAGLQPATWLPPCAVHAAC